jgi:hypothetical protein
MGVNHSCFNVAMAQEFLDRSNIVPAFEQVRGKGMPERTPLGLACRKIHLHDPCLQKLAWNTIALREA